MPSSSQTSGSYRHNTIILVACLFCVSLLCDVTRPIRTKKIISFDRVHPYCSLDMKFLLDRWTAAWNEPKPLGFHRKRNRFFGKIVGLSTCKGEFPIELTVELETQSKCKIRVLKNKIEIIKNSNGKAFSGKKLPQGYLGKRVGW